MSSIWNNYCNCKESFNECICEKKCVCCEEIIEEDLLVEYKCYNCILLINCWKNIDKQTNKK